MFLASSLFFLIHFVYTKSMKTYFSLYYFAYLVWMFSSHFIISCIQDLSIIYGYHVSHFYRAILLYFFPLLVYFVTKRGDMTWIVSCVSMHELHLNIDFFISFPYYLYLIILFIYFPTHYFTLGIHVLVRASYRYWDLIVYRCIISSFACDKMIRFRRVLWVLGGFI